LGFLIFGFLYSIAYIDYVHSVEYLLLNDKIFITKRFIRVTKSGGYIIILELYNRHRFFSFIIFYLTLFFSVFGFSFKSFGLGKNVIV
ncbi:MAG: hypothetical protein QW279_09530, partial [Candidatus Jordarchaeaceae archaeon]